MTLLEKLIKSVFIILIESINELLSIIKNTLLL